jgi:hypothetical protein
MEFQITQKGALYSAECDRCGATIYVHEWATWNNNDDRDALQAGTHQCPECAVGKANPETFSQHKGLYYAARYSAPGYLDCTEWTYGRQKRALVREVRDMYGEV